MQVFKVLENNPIVEVEDEWTGRARHIETCMDKIVNERSQQVEERVSERVAQVQEQVAATDRRVAEMSERVEAGMSEIRALLTRQLDQA